MSGLSQMTFLLVYLLGFIAALHQTGSFILTINCGIIMGTNHLNTKSRTKWEWIEGTFSLDLPDRVIYKPPIILLEIIISCR